MRRTCWIGLGLLLAVLATTVVVRRATDRGVIVAIVGVGTDPQGVAVDSLTGRAFVTNYFSDSVSVIDTRNGRALRTVAVGQTPLSVAIDARSNRAFVLNLIPSTALNPSGSLSTLDAGTGAPLWTAPLTATVDLAVDERSGHVVEAGDDGGLSATAFLLDAWRGRLLRTTALDAAGSGNQPPNETVAGLAVDPSTQRAFITLAGAGTVAVLDTVRGSVLRRVRVGAMPTGVAVDGPANRAFVANRADDTVSMLEARSGTVLRTVRVGRGPVSLAVDTRTQRLFVVNEAAGSVSVLDARTGRLYRTVRVGALRPQAQAQANAVDLAVDEGWRHVFVLNDGPITPGGQTLPGTVSVLDAATGRLIRTFAVGLHPSALAVDEVAGRLVVVNTGPPAPAVRADPWGWLPAELRARLPWAAPPAPNPLRGSVTLLDLARM